jgi:hypothetical protein
MTTYRSYASSAEKPEKSFHMSRLLSSPFGYPYSNSYLIHVLLPFFIGSFDFLVAWAL